MMRALGDNTLHEMAVEVDERSAAAVFLVSGGYPQAYEKGKAITGLELVEDSIVLHAGTRAEEGQIRTNGGRVLALTSFGENFKSAVARSMENAERVQFEGKYYRKDIGFDLQ